MGNGRVLWEMSAGETAAAAAVGPGRFEKELLRVGRWAHPAGKFVLEVTRDRLTRWVENFRRMLAKGIPVPVPYGHSYDARDNAGFVREMRVEEDRLVGVLEIPREEDARRLGATATAVSVSVNPEFVDGQGERLGEVIEHVAITNYPIVAGQANFVPLAAEMPAGGSGETPANEVESPQPGAGEPGAGEVIRLEMEKPGVGATGRSPEAESLADGSKGADALTPAPLPSIAEATEGRPGGEGRSLADKPPVAQAAEEGREDSPSPFIPLPGGEGMLLAEQRAALVARIAQLEGARIDGEVERLLLSGKISPAVEGHVRRLLGAGGQRIELSATGEEISPAEELRAIFAAMPEGAWVPLESRAAAARPLARRDSEVSDERAKQLAMENANMVKKGGESKDSNR